MNVMKQIFRFFRNLYYKIKPDKRGRLWDCDGNFVGYIETMEGDFHSPQFRGMKRYLEMING